MKGIVIKNSKDVVIRDNVFKNLDVAIEAENVTGLWLRGNRIVSKDERIDRLIRAVLGSKLSSSQKETLIKEVLGAIILSQKRELPDDGRKAFLKKISNILGRGAMELAKELLAEIVAGKILLR